MSGIRNVAIIAHVDHGKTTLVDKIIHQCNVVDERKETGELILDNNDLERERGITILAKNVSATWKDVKINLIDLRSRRLRRRGGACVEDGRRGVVARRRLRGAHAANASCWQGDQLGLKPIVVVTKWTRKTAPLTWCRSRCLT